MRRFFIASLLACLIFPGFVYSKIGVGVGTGKIQVDDKLKPGLIYELPPLMVLNTGDESSEYGMSVTYHEKQTELAPLEKWFNFSPERFSLDPGKVQTVAVKLNLPLKVQPGNYFAYLEAHPLKKSQSENTSVGIAAATKLYFTVVPANFFQGIYYKIVSFWKIYSPWTNRAALVLGVILLFFFFKRFFNIQIKLKNPEDKQSK